MLFACYVQQKCGYSTYNYFMTIIAIVYVHVNIGSHVSKSTSVFCVHVVRVVHIIFYLHSIYRFSVLPDGSIKLCNQLVVQCAWNYWVTNAHTNSS